MTRLLVTRLRAALAAVALLFAFGAHAAGPPVPPSPTAYVTDGAGILPPEARSALEAKLAAFEDDTSNQVLVFTAPKVPEGTTLEEFANAAFGAWKVGQREKKNGIVLFVFAQDRAARIEVGYGLEGALPDALAGRILNDEVFPRFREGDYAGGVGAGVDAVLAATKGEYTGTGSRRPARGRRRERIPWPVVFFLVFFLLPALLGRRRRPYWWLGGGGFGGGGFGGFGGGGFGGFSGGGGSSGGGGASGRW